MFNRFMGKSAAAAKEGAGQPLQLVSYDESTKKFTVGEEALKVLKSVRAPMGVVSVCGRARQGKSFILNQLLGQSSGFTVAPTHRPCTKGLWMWSSPVEQVGPDGSKHYLAMLDTEGIDAWDQTGQYSVQIFSLAVLLSSLFVYNQMGGIDEAALDRLSLVTEMTKHIRVRAAKGGQSAKELAQFTPSFLWLLRDFYLRLEEDGRAVTPREYLETALSNVPATSAGAVAKNGIRDSIKSLFPDRDCFTLVRPMSDEAKLAHLETVPPNQLRPEFREALARLVDTCFARAQPKRIGGTTLTGPMLAGLVTAYVDAINHGAVPTIATAWQGVAEAECRRAADAAEARHRELLDAAAQGDPGNLEAAHARAIADARALYDREAVGDAAIKEAHAKKWLEAAERTFAQLRDRRLAEAASRVEGLINKMNAQLNELASDPATSSKAISTAINSFLAEYEKTAEGPTKWRRLVEFMQSTIQVLVQRVESAAAQRQAAVATRVTELEQSLKAVRAESNKLRTAAGSEEARAQALERQLDAAHRNALSEVEAERRRLQEERQGAEQTLKAKIAELTTAVQQREATSTSATTSLQQAQQEVGSLKRRLDEANALLDAERRTAARLQVEHTTALSDVQEKLATAQRELGTERQRVAALQAERGAQAAALQAAQAETDRDVAQFGGGGGDDAEMAAADGEDVGGAENGALNPAQMTMPEIKEWLTDNGHEDVVWELSVRKPRAKKADWVELMRSKQ